MWLKLEWTNYPYDLWMKGGFGSNLLIFYYMKKEGTRSILISIGTHENLNA